MQTQPNTKEAAVSSLVAVRSTSKCRAAVLGPNCGQWYLDGSEEVIKFWLIRIAVCLGVVAAVALVLLPVH